MHCSVDGSRDILTDKGNEWPMVYECSVWFISSDGVCLFWLTNIFWQFLVLITALIWKKKTLFGAKSVFCVQTRYCEILAEGVVFFWFCAFVCFIFLIFFFFPLVQLKPKSSFSFRPVPLSLVCQSVCSHHLSVPHLRLWSGSSLPRHRRSSKSRKHVAAASVRSSQPQRSVTADQ